MQRQTTEIRDVKDIPAAEIANGLWEPIPKHDEERVRGMDMRQRTEWLAKNRKERRAKRKAQRAARRKNRD